MHYARQRQDLLDQQLQIPSGSGQFVQVPDWLEYEQPDNLEDSFYNCVLYKTTDNGTRYAWERFASIDLEFKEE